MQNTRTLAQDAFLAPLEEDIPEHVIRNFYRYGQRYNGRGVMSWTRAGQTYRYLIATNIAQCTVTFDEAYDRWPFHLG